MMFNKKNNLFKKLIKKNCKNQKINKEIKNIYNIYNKNKKNQVLPLNNHLIYIINRITKSFQKINNSFQINKKVINFKNILIIQYNNIYIYI